MVYSYDKKVLKELIDTVSAAHYISEGNSTDILTISVYINYQDKWNSGIKFNINGREFDTNVHALADILVDIDTGQFLDTNYVSRGMTEKTLEFGYEEDVDNYNVFINDNLQEGFVVLSSLGFEEFVEDLKSIYRLISTVY